MINLNSLLKSLLWVSIGVAIATVIAIIVTKYPQGLWILGILSLTYAIVAGYEIAENRRKVKDYEKLEFERKIEKMKNKHSEI